MNTEIKQFLNRIRWLAIALISGGFVVILLSEQYVKPLTALWGAVLSHVGIAILITGIIGLILELTEMTSFFEERLLSIVASRDFFQLLSDDKLSEYIFEAMQQKLRNSASSNYRDYVDLPLTIKRDILPELDGVYCEDYSDATEFNLLSHSDKEALKLDTSIPVGKLINRVTYDLIAPHEDQQTDITIRYYNDIEESNFLPINQQMQLRLFLSQPGEDEKEQDVDIEKYLKTEEGNTTLTLSYETKFKDYLRCRIECTMLTSPPPTYTIGYMKYPTSNVTVHFSSNIPVKPIGEIYGIVPDYTEPFETDHALTLRYPGWMLKDQGYFIRWDVTW